MIHQTFDFSGLCDHPPSGFSVVKADIEGLVLYRRKCNRKFFIIGDGKEFELYVKSVIDNPDSKLGSFVMRTNSLHRIMTLLGYQTRVPIS